MTERYKELLKYYRQVAKRADQRLVELEKLSAKDGYREVTKYAYRKAMYDIKRWSGESDKMRFNRKPPETTRALLSKIHDIEDFLDSKTSTKKGIDTVYKKRADTLNKKFGTKFKWQTLANFTESKTFEKISKKYGSTTLFKIVSTLQKFDVNEIKSGNVRIDDEVLNDAIMNALRENMVDMDDLW